MTVVEVEGRPLRLSSLDKVLWPAAGFTKREMVDYYRAVAPALLPHVAGRPVTLWRFPDGVEGPNWWQNECRGRPEWMATAVVRGQRFCLVNDLASLVWVANLGTIELHPFLARAGELEQPTTVVFDLDPGPPADVVDCCRVALRLRGVLDGLGLASWPKTSGSVGLHVYVPLNRPHTYAATKAFASGVAARLAGEAPDRVTDEQKRAARAGKVLVDWLQNDAMRSTVAAYSLRGTAWPTVSTPVTWEELERAAVAGRAELLTFDAAAVLDRLEQHGDLFRSVIALEQALPAPPSVGG